MAKRADVSSLEWAAVSSRSELAMAVRLWVGDGRAQRRKPPTLRERQQTMDRFIWWLIEEAELPPRFDILTPAVIRSFLIYLQEPRPAGRFGSDRASTQAAAKPATCRAYYRTLKGFLAFCDAERLLPDGCDPLRNVKPPKLPKERVEPLTQDQVQAILDVVRRGRAPMRDVAIILLLVDSGLRVSELCSLTLQDVNQGESALTVTGKGDKVRDVFIGVGARRAVWRYVELRRKDEPEETEALFVGVSGRHAGHALTPSGVHRIIAKAGKAAKIEGVRVSPHTLRHTFAVTMVEGGVSLPELQDIMGHEDIATLRRYLKFRKGHLERTHRAASPVDRLALR